MWKLFVHSDAHSGPPQLLRREWQTQDWDKLDQQGWEPTSRIQQRLMSFPFELQDIHLFVHKVHWNVWKSCCTGQYSDQFGCLVAGCDVLVLTKSTSCGSDEAFCTHKENPARINQQMHGIDEGWVVTCFLVIMAQKRLRRRPLICRQPSPSYQSLRYHQVYVGHWLSIRCWR